MSKPAIITIQVDTGVSVEEGTCELDAYAVATINGLRIDDGNLLATASIPRLECTTERWIDSDDEPAIAALPPHVRTMYRALVHSARLAIKNGVVL